MDLLFTTIILLSFAAWLWLLRALKRNPGAKLPPGPTQLPIFGNVFSLGSKPHMSLARLAQLHGPVMLLKLGSRTTVVISSPEAAKAVLQKQDQSCCSRSPPEAARALGHDTHSVAWIPVSPQWRTIRKLCKEKMFSVQKLDSSHGLRMEKLQKLVDHVEDCCSSGRAVEIGKATFTTALNLMWATLFSVDVAGFGSHTETEFREIVSGIMELIGKPNVSDYFPLLRAADPQGILKENTVYFAKCFAVFDEIIKQRMSADGGDRMVWNDMLEALLEFHRQDESGLSLYHIKHLLLDLFVAGSDTTSGTVEWAMTELIRSPDKMQKAKTELKTVLNPNQQIQESDISRLPYLRSIVKETFRLHPTVPLLVPRKTNEDTELNGYFIPENTQILINAWAIGRHPGVWEDPDRFMPERFLDKDTDFRGQHFELIPFGGGRRICLGIPLAHRMVHLMLANLVRDYEWKLEEGMEVDMEEKFGLSLQKATSLRVIPSKG